jgi:hypothetical protein
VARHEQPPARRKVRSALKGSGFWFASVWTGVWSVVALGLLGATLDGPDSADSAGGAAVTAVLAGVGVLALRPWRRKPVMPPRVTFRLPSLAAAPPARVRPEKRYRLPRPGSAARQPVRQLAGAESALAELLRQLRDSAVPDDVVDRAWRTATDTAAGLRAAAARFEAVEQAAEQLLPPARTTLEDGLRDLLTHIEQGLDAYRGLIAAAGRVLLASPATAPVDELAEETERLAAIAEALPELRSPTEPP